MIRSALLLATVAVTAAAPQPSDPQNHAVIDVPRGGRQQQVIVQSREFPSGAASDWHVHPGTEVGYVTAGSLEIRTAREVWTINAGDSFTVPRGMAHYGINTGTETVRLVITLIIDKGLPVRTAVPAPAGR